MVNPAVQTAKRPRRATKRQPQRKAKARKQHKCKLSYPLWVENLFHNLDWVIVLAIVELIVELIKANPFTTAVFLVSDQHLPVFENH